MPDITDDDGLPAQSEQVAEQPSDEPGDWQHRAWLDHDWKSMALPPVPSVGNHDRDIIAQFANARWTGLSTEEIGYVIDCEIGLLGRTKRSTFVNLYIARGLWVFQQYILTASGAEHPRSYAYRRLFTELATPEISHFSTTTRGEYVALWEKRAILMPWWLGLPERERRRWNSPATIDRNYRLGNDLAVEINTMADPHDSTKEIGLASPPGREEQAEIAEHFLQGENSRLRALLGDRGPEARLEEVIAQARDAVQTAQQWSDLRRSMETKMAEFFAEMDERWGNFS